jgi:hypothetical protein
MDPTQHKRGSGKPWVTVAAIAIAGMAGWMPGAQAAGTYPLYRGVRPLGMASASTAVADDENAAFYNPAGLVRVKRLELGIVNPLLECSQSALDLAKDADDTDFDNTSEVTDLLRKYIGEHEHVRFAALPFAAFPAGSAAGVAFGALLQFNGDLVARNPVWPEADVDAVVDLAAFGATGFKVPVEGLSFGVGLKYDQRQSLREVYTPAEIAADDFDDRVEDDQRDGSGGAADLGVLYKLPWEAAEARFGLAALNVPSMDMGDAEPVETELNAGASIEHQFGKIRLLGALDYQDLTSAALEDSGMGKRLHVGGEVGFSYLALRAGLSQGYLAGGASLDFRLLKLELATYSEEVGVYAGDKEDRRYVAQVSLGW